MIKAEMAATIQRMGDRAEYIKISGNGPNALDFHIAYYIGRIAAKEPGVCFHIISKDAGFDPLINHLKSKKILAFRSLDVMEIAVLKTPPATAVEKPAEDQMSRVIADLKRRSKARPKTVKTLANTINSVFQNKLQEREVTALVAQLVAKGVVKCQDGKVSYVFPK